MSENQQGDKYIKGIDLREELVGQLVYNANLLDFYLKNLHLILEEWKGKAVFFWGTVYRSPKGRLYVRCLYWSGERWDWLCYFLEDDWSADSPAAVLRK